MKSIDIPNQLLLELGIESLYITLFDVYISFAKKNDHFKCIVRLKLHKNLTSIIHLLIIRHINL